MVWEINGSYGDIRVDAQHKQFADLIAAQGVPMELRGKSCVLSRNEYVIDRAYEHVLEAALTGYLESMYDAWMATATQEPGYPHIIVHSEETEVRTRSVPVSQIQPPYMCRIYTPPFLDDDRECAYVDMRGLRPVNGHVDIEVPASWPRRWYTSEPLRSHIKDAEAAMSRFFETPIRIHYHPQTRQPA